MSKASVPICLPRHDGAERTYAEMLKESLAHLPSGIHDTEKIIFMDRLPMTGNGKVDRKASGAQFFEFFMKGFPSLSASFYS